MTFKKLAYRFIILLALVFTMDQALGWYLDSIYEENTYDYNNGRLNLFLKKERCDTLYIGSSRVLHTINPSFLGPGSKVLAYQNKNICHNVALFDVIAMKGKHPRKTLVFNLDMDDLHRTSNMEMLEKVNNLKYYYYENELVQDLINRIGFQERFKLLSRVYKHNGAGWKLLSFPLHGNRPKVSENGYMPLFPTENDSLRLARSMEEDFEGLQYNVKNALTYEMIDTLIDRCEQLNIELIIINTPYYTYPKEWVKMSEEFKNYCKERNTIFLDFNLDRPDSIESARYWYDNMHMNDFGAELFSKFMKSRLYPE